jgi:hypothetical protein
MLDPLIAGLAELTPDGLHEVLAPLGGFLSRPEQVIRIPDEPTTLALALISLGTVGAYVAVTQYLRPERVGPVWPGRLSDKSETIKPASEPRKVPRRGAA